MEIFTAKIGGRFIRGYTEWIKHNHHLAQERGTFNGYTLFTNKDHDNDLYYYAMYDNKVAAFLFMEHMPKWKAKEESVVYAADAHRGRGLVQALYDLFVHTDKGIIVSDNLHTDHAVAMWKKFIREQRYDIYAINLLNQRHKAHVFWDDEQHDVEFVGNVPELWFDTSDHHMYNLARTCDIRLVAHAPVDSR